MTIGENIRALRKSRGLTQAQLGRLCGLSGGAIGSYEHGTTTPKRRTAEKLAAALDVPLERIMTEPALCTAARPQSREPELLHDGVLTVLRQIYGSVEGREVLGANGDSRKYYLVRGAADSFVLYDRDVAAIARSARDSMLPLVEYMRRTRGGDRA